VTRVTSHPPPWRGSLFPPMVEDLCRTPFYQIVNYKEYCDERICLCVCVCLSARDYISGTTHPIFSKCFVNVTYGRGSSLL